jgi:predicted lysophospholipase L1 biosynthesis ABC-type transport system permease subunit
MMGLVGLVAGWLVSGRVAALAGSYVIDQRRPTDVFVPNAMPTAIAAAALVCIVIAGTYGPLRRTMRMDVMRVVQGT